MKVASEARTGPCLDHGRFSGTCHKANASVTGISTDRCCTDGNQWRQPASASNLFRRIGYSKGSVPRRQTRPTDPSATDSARKGNPAAASCRGPDTFIDATTVRRERPSTAGAADGNQRDRDRAEGNRRRRPTTRRVRPRCPAAFDPEARASAGFGCGHEGYSTLGKRMPWHAAPPRTHGRPCWRHRRRGAAATGTGLDAHDP